jgi:hypothetical protein
VALLAIGFAAVLASNDEGHGEERKALLAYQAKLLPLVQHWGRIEIQGMRPAIADLQDPAEGVPDQSIGAETNAWNSALVAIRKDIRAVRPPPALRKSSLLFDQSIVKYIDAALLFRQAVAATGEARDALIQQGIDTAMKGAGLYNEASILLQRARRSVGLPLTSDFPDRPAGEEKVS